MPLNGSGVYVPPSSPGAFNPAVSGQNATPTAWNALLADISAAISTMLATDGQSTVTQNLPMANHKLTGLAAGSAATDSVNVGQIQSNTSNYAADSGAADAYVITLSPSLTTYTVGQTFKVLIANTNLTTTPTLKVDGLNAGTIVLPSGAAVPVASILTGEVATFVVSALSTGTPTFQLGTVAAPLAQSGFSMTGAINEAKGIDIASATTTDIGAATGNFVHVTGTTTITALGTIQAGTERTVEFTGILILTHNGTSLILPTGANITTAAGDTAIFRSEGSANWRCISYQRASGASLVLFPAFSQITNSLASDVAINIINTDFTGPTIAQGTVGTWWASGQITINNGQSGSGIKVRLWDGTTVIDSTSIATQAGPGGIDVHLSGYLASPAGNIRITCQCTNSTANAISANLSGYAKDSTVSAIRIA